MQLTKTVLIMAVLFAVSIENATAQNRADPAALIATQRAAMSALHFLDGAWRGTANTVGASGEQFTVTQTERIGPFLDGSVKVIEGRGYDKEGKVRFNAFGTISYNPDTRAYTMRSHAMGHVGDFPVTITPDGWRWSIPAGPITIRYDARIRNGVWHEVGERLEPGKKPERFFEMTVTRIGDTDWPAGGAIAP